MKWRPSGGVAPIQPFVFVLGASSVVELATDTPKQQGRWLGPFFRLTPATQTTSACCAAALVLLTLFMLGRRPLFTSSTGSAHFARLIGLLPAISMVLAFFWTGPYVDSAYAIPWNAMVVVAPLLLCVSAFRRWPPIRTAGVVAAVGIAVRLVHFARFSIDEGADMLPLTKSAIARFLTGHSPYTYYDLPDPVPLTYYPLTWLAFVPAYLAHVDLRWTNIAAEMAVLAAVVSAGRVAGAFSARPGMGEPTGRWDAGRAAVVAWSFCFLLPSSVYFDRITTAPFAWAMISWCVVLSARDSPYGWVVLGLTAATTPLALIVAPFVFVMWWHRHSLREAVVRGVMAGLVATVMVLPFIVWSPRGFVDGAVLWFNDLSRYPGVTWKDYRPWERYVGFGGLFWRHGLERALSPIQWFLVGTLAVVFARKRALPSLLPAHVAAAFIAFMVFNSVHWPYFYQPAIFGALVAVAVAARRTRTPVSRSRGVAEPERIDSCLESRGSSVV